MNIVIVGAGKVGRYIASLLSKEQHSVTLIDKDSKILEEAASTIDLAIREGSGTDWQLLDDLMDLSPDLMIALTKEDETNLAICSMAKNLGYPRAIARVRDEKYLNCSRLDFSRMFDVDYFIGPELLAAYDIFRHMTAPGTLSVQNFFHGAVQMRTVRISSNWRYSHIPLNELVLPAGIIIGLICRKEEGGEKIIFPHGSDALYPEDEVAFIGESESVLQLYDFLGFSEAPVKNALVVGGSLTGMSFAKILEKEEIHCRIIEKDLERCEYLAKQLPKTTIIHRSGNDPEVLNAEKVADSDIFVAATNDDELNLVAAKLAKEAGATNAVVQLMNPSYRSLISSLGISYAVSPLASAGDYILSVVLSGAITSVVSLYDGQAEIVEIQVSQHSKATGIPLSELGPLLPKDFLIGMIQNRGRITVARGNRILSPGDTIIVITHPRHIPDIKMVF